MQVRTENFKKWFGDWAAAEGRKELLEGKPVALTGNEVFQAAGGTLDMKALHSDARKWANANVTGNFTNRRSGIAVEVRPRGIKNSINHGGGPDKLRAFAAIPSLLTDGVVTFLGKNPKKPNTDLIVIAKRVRISDSEFVVSAGIQKDPNGKLYYDHELLDVRRVEGLSSKSEAATEVAEGASVPTSTRLNDYTVRFMGQADDASKVTDANGEPLAVFHGTNQGFDTFKPDAFRSAYFFSSDPKVSSEFADAKYSGANVVQAFLSLKNPLIVDADGASWVNIPYKGRTAGERTTMKEAEEAGHDGVILKSVLDGAGPYGDMNPADVYVAFAPNQIKSAIGNNGDFNPNDPRITHSATRPSENFFYSQMAEALDLKLNPKGHGEAMAKQIESLAKNGQFKQEEMEWSGVVEWLRSKENVLRKVAKQEVMDYLKANEVQVSEVIKGGQRQSVEEAERLLMDAGYALEMNVNDTPLITVAETGEDAIPGDMTEENRQAYDLLMASGADMDGTRYSKYQAPGGENYRECLGQRCRGRDGQREPVLPMGLEDKSLVYLNQEMSPEYSERSGTRLPSEVRILRGYEHKVLTDHDLVKYHKGRAAYAANR